MDGSAGEASCAGLILDGNFKLEKLLRYDVAIDWKPYHYVEALVERSSVNFHIYAFLAILIL